MSKKRISNRLDELFDGIKEEEKATKSSVPPKKKTRKRKAKAVTSGIKATLPSPTVLRKEVASLDVQIDIAASRSTMSLPLRVDAESWATLQVVGDDTGRQWDTEEQLLVQQVTEQLTLALESAHLFQETVTRTEELALINEIVGKVSQTLDLNKGLQIIAEELANVVAAHHVGIALLTEDKTQAILVADAPLNEANIGLSIPVVGTTEKVIKGKVPITVGDIRTDSTTSEIKEVLLKRGTLSLVVFPLRSGIEVIGTVGIDFAQPNRNLTADETRLIETILVQASTSIETARLFDEAQLSEERARVIVQNAPEAIVMIDMDTGLYIEPNDNALQLFGLSKEEILTLGPADVSPLNQPDGRPSTEAALEKIQLALDGGAPVFDWTHLHYSSGKEIFCEVRLVQLPDTTRTIVRTSVVDIAERKYNELLQAAVSNISNAALSAQNLQELMQEVHQIVGTLMPANNFYIALYEEVRDLLSFPYFVDEIDTAWEPQKSGRGLTSYVLRTEKPLLATRSTIDELEASGEVELMGTKGSDWIGVPLKSGGKPIGVMVVQTYDAKVELTEENRDVLDFVGRQVSSALESKQSELELRALFSAMEDVIFVVDSDTRYLRIAPTNPAGLYRPPEDLLGKRMDEILPEDTSAFFRDAIKRALEGDETVNIEYSLDIGGKDIWFYASLSKLAENQVYWIARDITERKQAELQVQRLGNAVEQSLDGMAIADMDGNLEFVNPAWAEMHGYATTEELLGQALAVFHTKEQLKNEVAPFNEIVGAEGSNQGEIGHKRQDGSIFPTWMTVGVLMSVDDKPLALVASAQDITERKKDEQTLRRQNEYMSAAADVGRLVTSTLDMEILFRRTVTLLLESFNYYHVSIFTTDESGFNAIIRESTGDAGEEMKKRKHSLEINDASIVGTAMSTSEPFIVNNVTLGAHHQINPLLPDTKAEAAIPLRVGTRIIGALDLQSDKVDAFTPEDIIVLQILADQVAVAIDNARSYELAQEAVREMREIDKLKSQFLANMSHELRTPLNSIIGFSRVILKGIDGPVTDLQQEDLTAIYNSGQHLLGLINDILDLSKIEAGKMDLSFDELNVDDLVKSVMSTATGLVKDKPVRLVQEVAPDLPTVRGDPMRIRQVLINLLSNATKFTDEGEIVVKADLQKNEQGKEEVLISVTDSGAGISAEDQEKLFLAFSQVDASATRAAGGTGLGLSICQQLIHMHGGEIGVDSAVDEGSTFFFTIPLFHVKVEVPEGEENRIILAIDDDPQVISLYERYLTPQGYKVIALTDPKAAKKRVAELKPHAVTLDIMMPHYDGWQVLADLKSDAETRDIPIIICSIVEDSDKGYTLGATDYLVKPIIEEDLMGALNRLNVDGNIREILIIDDDPDDLRLLGKLLADNGRYKSQLAEGGRAGWDAITSAPPHAILLDLFMPEMNGFEIIEKLRTSPDLRDIPVIIISGGDLTPEQQEKLAAYNHHLIQKGSLDTEQLMDTLEKSLKRIQSK